MGVTDFFSAVYETFAQPSPDAEAPSGGASTDSPASGTDEQSKEEAAVNKEDEKKDDGEGEQGQKPSGDDDAEEGEGEEEEEEEEEETKDPKETFEEGGYSISEDVYGAMKKKGDRIIWFAQGVLEQDRTGKRLPFYYMRDNKNTMIAHMGDATIANKVAAECSNSKECAGPKHHYEQCVDRVTGQIENDGKASEDCIEEFFHLAHCATQCAAPKVFAALK